MDEFEYTMMQQERKNGREAFYTNCLSNLQKEQNKIKKAIDDIKKSAINEGIDIERIVKKVGV